MMRDAQGRCIRYLRLSITQACGMRCIYCRPAGRLAGPSADELSADKLKLLVGHLVARHGLRKVRLTGGEPTARPDLLRILPLAAIPGLEELAL